jgi:hypothetical protein
MLTRFIHLAFAICLSSITRMNYSALPLRLSKLMFTVTKLSLIDFLALVFQAALYTSRGYGRNQTWPLSKSGILRFRPWTTTQNSIEQR